MERGQSIHVDNSEHLCDILEKMIALLVETGDAFAVVSVGEPGFMQVMANDDGALRLESSSSDRVLEANLGFEERLEHYEHIAASYIPAGLPSKERYVAKIMTRLAVEVHDVEFPRSLKFDLDVNDLVTQS